jgi:S-(hydroxymethyl)glutathione dehydrogenase/alcohol dehydrogenase
MKTRAAVFTALDEPMDVGELDLADPERDNVLIEMAAVGVCGSDLHVVKGEWVRPKPMVLGHEGAGIVKAVGPDVSDVAVGDRVIISWAPSCGECSACLRGRPAACAKLRVAIGAGTLVDGTTGLSRDGETVYRMTTVGAFADHVLVTEKAAIKIPDDVALDQAALLGCAALTGVGAVENAAKVEAGSSAVVIGAGAVGQFVVQGLRIAGATRIVAVDPGEARRAQAVELGATEAVDPDGLAGVLEAMPEGFDYAFEAVGSAGTAKVALDAIRNGGVCVLVGMARPGDVLEVDPFALTAMEKTLMGSIYGTGDPAVMTGRLLGYIADGRLVLESMIGPRYDLDDINDAVDFALKGEGGRALVVSGGAG